MKIQNNVDAYSVLTWKLNRVQRFLIFFIILIIKNNFKLNNIYESCCTNLRTFVRKKMYLYKLQFLVRKTRSSLTKNNNYLPYVFLNT